jgi:hypothetical protein
MPRDDSFITKSVASWVTRPDAIPTQVACESVVGLTGTPGITQYSGSSSPCTDRLISWGMQESTLSPIEFDRHGKLDTGNWRTGTNDEKTCTATSAFLSSSFVLPLPFEQIRSSTCLLRGAESSHGYVHILSIMLYSPNQSVIVVSGRLGIQLPMQLWFSRRRASCSFILAEYHDLPPVEIELLKKLLEGV